MIIKGNWIGSASGQINMRKFFFQLDLKYTLNVHGNFWEATAYTAGSFKLIQHVAVNHSYKEAKDMLVWVISSFLPNIGNGHGNITVTEVHRAAENFLQEHQDCFKK